MNSFGRLFRISIFGESHTGGVGVLLDGVPCGLEITKEDFTKDLSRRKAGLPGTTLRVEADDIIISSGVFNDYTTGAPICINFLNTNVNSKDYDILKNIPRPGHADFTSSSKYNGFNDYRGGGHFSGRLTAGIVAAGVIAKKITNYQYNTKIVNLGGVTNENEFEEVILKTQEEKNSIGGIVEIVISNINDFLGEPFFDSVESYISHLLFSVGGVKGVEFGIGFKGINLKGSEFNDIFIDSKGTTKTNNNGGINGGIANKNDIIVRVFVKPTSSIFQNQETFNFSDDKMDNLKIEGRHDTAIVLRAQVVLEAMVSIALADLYLINKAYKKE